eukprot:9787860-Alexandrium_andersonii.AAC.1
MPIAALPAAPVSHALHLQYRAVSGHTTFCIQLQGLQRGEAPGVSPGMFRRRRTTNNNRHPTAHMLNQQRFQTEG